MAQQDENRWHLDKKVPISLMLVLLMQGVAGVWAVADIKKDVELLKAAMIEQRNRDERQDKTTTDAVLQVRSDIKELSQKLDRLIERGKP